MNKGLQALKEIKEYHWDCDGTQERIKIIEKDLDRLEKYEKVKEFLKTNPSHLPAILGFDNYETFKNYYSYYYTKDVNEEIFNLVKEVFE